MSKAWPRLGVEDACELIVDCLNRTAPIVEYPTDFKMIRTTNVRDGWINFDGIRCVTAETYEIWTRRAVPRRGDILLTREAPLGEVGIVRTDDQIFLGQRLVMYRANPAIVLPEFLYYAMLGDDIQAQIRAFGFGSTVSHMRVPDAKKLTFNCPPIAEQRRVVELIGCLDEQIDIGRRQIEILEEAARLIYTEWFVRLRFPGHKQARTGTYELPSGWQATSIGTVTSYLNRGVAPSYDVNSPKQVINQKCIRDRQLSLEQARNLANEISSEKWLQKGDVLINSTGTGTLGRVAQVREELDSVTVDTHVTIVRPRTEIPPWFFGQQLLRMEALFESLGEGATNQTELKRDRIRDTGFLLPSPQIMAAFDEKVEPMIEQIEVLRKQIAQLRQARDLLLPRLISGQLRL